MEKTAGVLSQHGVRITLAEGQVWRINAVGNRVGQRINCTFKRESWGKSGGASVGIWSFVLTYGRYNHLFIYLINTGPLPLVSYEC